MAWPGSLKCRNFGHILGNATEGKATKLKMFKKDQSLIYRTQEEEQEGKRTKSRTHRAKVVKCYDYDEG